MRNFLPHIEGRVLTVLAGPVVRLHKRLNMWFLDTAGGDDRPVLFDIDRTFPQLREVGRAYPEIRDEFMAAAESVAVMPTYHELDPMQRYISATTPHDWRMFYLYSMGAVAEDNVTLCPRTVVALKQVPNVFQASFSILDPGKSIPMHAGPYYGYLRYHLGIEVPEDDPPSLRIGGHVHTWKEGESLLFDDSWHHEVVNDSAQRRVVLIVDVLRPMPRRQHLANRFFTFVMRFFYGRVVLRRLRQRTEAAVPEV